MSIQDSNNQASYRQQSLSSDKKPLGLFLGAGCPIAVRVGEDEKSPLIPGITEITKMVRDEQTKSKDCAPLLSGGSHE
jgi:hypothetical protein